MGVGGMQRDLPGGQGFFARPRILIPAAGLGDAQLIDHGGHRHRAPAEREVERGQLGEGIVAVALAGKYHRLDRIPSQRGDRQLAVMKRPRQVGGRLQRLLGGGHAPPARLGLVPVKPGGEREEGKYQEFFHVSDVAAQGSQPASAESRLEACATVRSCARRAVRRKGHKKAALGWGGFWRG